MTFRTAPVLNDGIIGGLALIDASTASAPTIGADFASYLGTGLAADQGVGALGTTGFAGYSVHAGASIGSASPTENVFISGGTGTVASIGSVTINSLKFEAVASSSPIIAQQPGTTLTIDSGGVIFTGSASTHILGSQGGVLTTLADAIYFHVATTGGATSAVAASITGPNVAVVKDMNGTLTLSGNNSYGGGYVY